MAGFDFHQNRVPAKLWKQKATSPEMLAALPGFSLQSAGLFHAFGLELSDIQEAAAAGDYSQVAKPVVDVLEHLEAAVPVITEHLGARA